MTDIGYVWTAERWLYLAAILDLLSRRVVGLAMSERIDRALVLEALRNAVGRRLPNAGLMHHSDRGLAVRQRWETASCVSALALRDAHDVMFAHLRSCLIHQSGCQAPKNLAILAPTSGHDLALRGA